MKKLTEEINKIKKIMGINESEDLLTEKLVDVEEDVDYLYDTYFKEDIDEIQRTGIITPSMFNIHTIYSDTLKSKEAIDATLASIEKFGRPATIFINKKFSHGINNFYSTKENIIAIGVGRQAVEYALDMHNGDVEKSANGLTNNLKFQFKQEFTEEKIKGSIHHELVHWYDEMMHNNTISKNLDRYGKEAKKNRRQKNAAEGSGRDINFEYIERQAQIHNVKQLYNKHKDKWDTITFKEMISLSPPLHMVYQTTGDKNLRDKWVRLIKQRMHREGLLGKNMVNT